MEHDDPIAADSLARDTTHETELQWSGVASPFDPIEVPDVSRFFWAKRSLLTRALLVVAALFVVTLAGLATAVAESWFFEAQPESPKH